MVRSVVRVCFGVQPGETPVVAGVGNASGGESVGGGSGRRLGIGRWPDRAGGSAHPLAAAEAIGPIGDDAVDAPAAANPIGCAVGGVDVIAAGARDHPVVARPGADRVVSESRRKAVVTGETDDRVGTSGAPDPIGRRGADQLVGAIGAAGAAEA